jgi:hypothetical protein
MNFSTITVCSERFRQLQILATKDEVSLAGLVDEFVNRAVHEGRLPNEVPGWTVRRQRDHVTLIVHETNQPSVSIERRLTPLQAKGLADTLDRFTVTGSKIKGTLDLDVNLEIRRQGSGIKIVDKDTNAFRAVPRGVASDIADLLAVAAQ